MQMTTFVAGTRDIPLNDSKQYERELKCSTLIECNYVLQGQARIRSRYDRII